MVYCSDLTHSRNEYGFVFDNKNWISNFVWRNFPLNFTECLLILIITTSVTFHLQNKMSSITPEVLKYRYQADLWGDKIQYWLENLF